LKPEFERVATLPPGDVVVSLLEHKGTVFVATHRQVFYLVDGAFAPVEFILQKEGPAEASPKGFQHPEEKPTTREHGNSV
jgi:hypothetical protein